MTHLSDTRSRAEATPSEWLGVGKTIGQFVNDRAKRDDIITYLGEGAGRGSAACFVPALAEMELDREIAFGKLTTAEQVGDYTERDTLFEFPKASGAIIHESGHARWTLWPLEEMRDYAGEDRERKLESGIVEYFEEPRIEGLAVREWPDDRAFLRASAMEIVMGDIDIEELKQGSPYELSRLMLLTLARRDAGVLDDEDVEELEEFFNEFFGEELLDKFAEIWTKALAVTDHERGFEIMLPWAKEWMELLPEDPDLTDEMKEKLEQLQEMLEDAGFSAEIGGMNDAAEQQQEERDAAEVAERQSANKERQEHEQVADKVFGKSTDDVPDRITSSRIMEKRPPKDSEKRAAVIVGQLLDRARYRDRVETEVHSEMPPGRLDARQAVLGAAQKANGAPVTAQPWRNTLRRHVEDPNLTLGIMTDISGSMNAAMEPMAVMNYVLANAGHRIQARYAAVHFGQSVFPTLKPNQKMDEIVVRTAADGTERFDLAFRALNGELQLLDGSGARLLVICSDTCWVSAEVSAFERWMRRCVDARVGVLLLPFGNDYHIREKKNLPAEVHWIAGRLSPADAAQKIGEAAAKALETVGNKE